MIRVPQIETERLLLRSWRDEDLEPFAALNADPVVMRFFPGLLSMGESASAMARIRAHFDRHGFGLWAVEIPKERTFVGFLGLSVPGFDAPFTPCVEIGWRLDRGVWKRGFATEGARAVLAIAFGRLGLSEVVSFTVPENRASRRVMEKIGMRYDPSADFDHPRIPDGPLKRHVLYRIEP